MDSKNKTSIRPGDGRMVSASKPRAVRADAMRRTLARNVYRAKIESLLDKSSDERLGYVWQRVCPLPVDSVHELPDRRGVIKDLADFAEVLRPNLDGMKPQRLCRLIENYAACEVRRSDPSLPLAGQWTSLLNRTAQRTTSRAEFVATLYV
jgi:hypothetical protein